MALHELLDEQERLPAALLWASVARQRPFRLSKVSRPQRRRLVRAEGVEPSWLVSETRILPLDEARMLRGS
jgi:hypothetical protein